MTDFIYAAELKKTFRCYGHFYRLQVEGAEPQFCRSVLEITSLARESVGAGTDTHELFSGSGEASLPVTGYQIYRLVENAMVAQLTDGSQPQLDLEAAGFKVCPIEGANMWSDGDRVFAQAKDMAGTFPPGTWEAVGWVAATQSDDYIAAIPTYTDSTGAGGNAWVKYLVTTHTTTPSEWFVSPPDRGNLVAFEWLR